MRYAFSDCELDTGLYVLHRHGRIIRLRPKVFQVLLYLLEHRDEVVSKHDLMEAVWPDQYISDATLADTIRTIRQSVGDQPRQAHVIRTRHGHGYHFVAAVTVVADPGSEEPSLASSALDAPASHGDLLSGSKSYVAGERKVVTMLCSSLGRSISLLELLGLDALQSLIHTRYDLVKGIVQQYGGTLQPLQGDRVLAVFGVPMTHEDHAWRAALAALAIRDGLQGFPQTDDPKYRQALAVRLGLHTGQIAVEARDPTLEQAIMLIGEAVTMSTALQAHAEPGSILCSKTTARLLQEVADLEPHAPILLPEQSQPVIAYTLLAPRGVSWSRHWVRPLSPFVGREWELATLEGLLARAQSGQGHAVVMVGEPGIGKSRLLYEFRRRQVDKPVAYVAGECLSYGTASPYLPVLQLLRQMCAITEADSPETIALKVSKCLQKVQMPIDPWAPPLLDLLGGSTLVSCLSTLSPQARKARLFSALLQLCVRLSQQCPLVLEVENLHWIDATSEDWLKVLADSLSSHSMLLLMTCRPEYRPDWLDVDCVTVLSLSGLNPQQSRQLLQAVPLAAQVPAPLARQLLAKADGNPLFLEELTRAMVEHPSDSIPLIPDHIQAVLAARMDRLPTDEKQLLQVAAVIGKDIPLPLLEGAAGLPGAVLQSSLGHLRMAGFLYEAYFSPHLVYTFKHTLTQDVAYQSLLLSSRQPYHYQIAQLLVERFPGMASSQPELVAHHYTESGHVDEALPYWQRAGEQAVARSANLEAIRHFTKGLAVLKHLPLTMEYKRHELRIQLALSAPLYMIKGPAPDVEQTYQRVLELCRELQDNVRYFSGLAGLWRFLFNQGQLQKSHELGQQCLNLVSHTQELALLAETHLMLGSTCLSMGELHTARTHFQQGTSLSDRRRAHAQAVYQVVDPGIMCCCRGAWALWLLGYADQALATINRALTLAKAMAHAFDIASALFYASIIHQCRREVDAVHECSEAVIALASEQELIYFVPGGLCGQGWALTAQGESERGLAKFREGLTTWQANGIAANLSPAYVALADIYYRCGQIASGLQALDEAYTIVHANAERYYEPEVYRLRGELLLHPSIQDAEQAEACFQHARDIAARQQAKAWELRATMSLCRLWHQQGHHQAARCQLELVYNWFTEGFSTLDLLEAQAFLEVLRGS